MDAARVLVSSRPGQNSTGYRIGVLLTVLVSEAAVVNEGAVGLVMGVVTFLLIPVGFAVSYVRRHERNILLKVVLAAGLLVAFGDFLRSVRFAQSVDDARAPLAALFLWVQVLHSFDLPNRRDLNFSFASSVALIALAGTLSISSGFALVLLLYVLVAALTLVLGHLSELQELAGPDRARERKDASTRTAAPVRGLARPVVAAGGVALALSSVAFVALPRLPGARVTALPFSFVRRTPLANFAGGVLNPGLSRSAGRTGGFSPNAYFGYGDSLSLRVRGRLSDEIVMRVRAAHGDLWRGQVYDRYDGTEWTSTDTSPGLRPGTSAGGSIPVSVAVGGDELVQTFYVERDLPNLVFHALAAREVYVPSASVHVDDFGSIRLPYTLERDTIYSVISEVPTTRRRDLVFGPPYAGPPPGMERYLAMTPSLGARFNELARRITGPYALEVEKVGAVERWLHENTRYKLDVPHDPPGVDPVDYFLFERKEGFCEQIASSMTLLLRASGIPARLVTGFGPGRRNPLTGYWEVRNSDAHAWVEVWYPNGGWMPYDPTFGVPEAPSAGDLFGLKPIASLLGTLLPSGVRNLAGRAVGAVAGAARAAPAVPLALVVLVIPAAILLRARLASGRRARDPRGRIVASYLDVERALASRGLERRRDQTVGEYAAWVREHAPAVEPDELRRLVDLFSRTRYGRDPAGDDEAAQAEALSAALSRAARSGVPRVAVAPGGATRPASTTPSRR